MFEQESKLSILEARRAIRGYTVQLTFPQQEDTYSFPRKSLELLPFSFQFAPNHQRKSEQFILLALRTRVLAAIYQPCQINSPLNNKNRRERKENYRFTP